MTDKKISELASNGTLTGAELVELVQSGSNVNALLRAIKTWVINGLATNATAKTEYLTIACSDETTKVIAVSNGGNPRSNSGGAYFFAETHTAGDGGCPVLATLATNGGGSQAAGDIGYIYAGDGGNGGANGDYAINGNSLITWLNTGLIYGNIV